MSALMTIPSTRLRVRQIKEWVEILFDWETQNKYAVVDDQDRQLFFAGEVGGLGNMLWRYLLGPRRPFTMEVRGRDRLLALKLERPFTFFFNRLEVFDGAGAPVGTVQQRFKIFGKRYDLLDPSGRVLGEIRGPLFSPWTFEIFSNGQQAGLVKKRWSGLLGELFTDADNFSLTFSAELSPSLRALMLASTFLIDFAYFEHQKHVSRE
jgi:uncharacterized protein YxjI